MGSGDILLTYPARQPAIDATFVLAHGAGAPQQSAFMVGFARGLAERGLDVLTFNFPYMQQRRRVPDKTAILDASYRDAVVAARDRFRRDTLFIGGKSMGGRIATYLAAAEDAITLGIGGVVLLGYPLHPPGKPAQLRSAHLPHIRVPMLFVQGERDPFGTPDELRPILDTIPADVTLHAVIDADHSLTPPKRSGTDPATVYADIQGVIARWIAAKSS